MHPQTYAKTVRPGLTAAMTAGRALLAAGWRYDSTSPMADDTTIRTLLHPSGREIHARTVDRDDDDTTSLTMTGLSLEQVAGAITGAGLGEPAQPVLAEPRYMSCPRECGVDVREHNSSSLVDGKCDTEPDHWLTLADDLRQAADRVATLAGTIPPVKVQLHVLGAFPGNTDRTASTLVDTVAAAFEASTYSNTFPAGDSVYQAQRELGSLRFHVSTYLPPELSELERLRARNAELEARLAEGGAAR